MRWMMMKMGWRGGGLVLAFSERERERESGGKG